jgi:transcription initiation factor TFIID subunit 4
VQVTTTPNKTQASSGAQLKQIVTNNNVNIINNNNAKNNNTKNQVSIAVVSTVNSTHVTNSKLSTTSPNISKSPTKSNAISNSHSLQSTHSSNTTSTTTTSSSLSSSTPTKSPLLNNKTHHEKKSQGSAAKAKDKKTSLASVVAASSGSNSNTMSNFYPSTFGDDDINDVAAMGGVNLAEESQRILGSTEYVGTQIRSCKDEVLLNLSVLQQRIRTQMARHGIDEPSTDIAVLISHATQEHLKNIVEKLSVIAEHRIDILKVIK